MINIVAEVIYLGEDDLEMTSISNSTKEEKAGTSKEIREKTFQAAESRR